MEFTEAVLKMVPASGRKPCSLEMSGVGAVYSSSPTQSLEFPDLQKVNDGGEGAKRRMEGPMQRWYSAGSDQFARTSSGITGGPANPPWLCRPI